MKKRLALSILAIAAISLIVSAATFALFSATTDNVGNTFTAGTVSLGEPANALIDVENLAPGDDDSAGTFTVTYAGSLDAWLGLDTACSGDLFAGTHPLEVTITDGTNNYVGNAANQVVGKVSDGASVAFEVLYEMPLAAGNEYQGKGGSVSLTIHAVQSRNNTNAAGTGPTSWQ